MTNQTDAIKVYRAMDTIDSYIKAGPSEEQLSILDNFGNTYKDLIEVIVDEGKILEQSPEGAAKIAAIEKYLKEYDSPINGEQLAVELLFTNNFLNKILEKIIEISKKITSVTSDLKGIGLGVAYHIAPPKGQGSKGKEKGVEAIYILPRTVGGDKISSQFASRSWDYQTTRLRFDVIARANLNFSFWFGNPASADLLAGILGELAVIPALSLNAVGIIPKSSDLTKAVGSIPWPSLINSISLGIGLGLGAGAAVINGSQDVTIQQSNMTLFVTNPETDTAVMKISQPTTLKVTLTYPYVGETPSFILNNNSEKVTTLSIVMPNFVLDSLTTATGIPPTNWKFTGTSSGGFDFEYTGADNSAWNDNLEFTLSNLESNANITSPQTGSVQANMNNITRSSGFNVPGLAIAPLELTALIFTASINWNVTLGNGFTHDGTIEENDITIQTPPSNFQTLPYGDIATIITDTTTTPQTQWNVGLKFQVNANKEPVIVVAWQEVDNPPIGQHNFATGQIQIGTSQTDISIGFKGNSQSSTQFKIEATLQS